jgi:hypothetical protein
LVVAFPAGFVLRGPRTSSARISLYRKGRSNTGYLDKRKLVIWCFTACEFAEGSGWRKLPVAPKRIDNVARGPLSYRLRLAV